MKIDQDTWNEYQKVKTAYMNNEIDREAKPDDLEKEERVTVEDRNLQLLDENEINKYKMKIKSICTAKTFNEKTLSHKFKGIGKEIQTNKGRKRRKRGKIGRKTETKRSGSKDKYTNKQHNVSNMQGP